MRLWANFVWRVIIQVHHSGHGGMLAPLPTEKVAQYVSPAATLRPKYQLQQPTGDHYYMGILAAIMRRLLKLGDVSWLYYQQAGDACLVKLQRTLDHYAELLADLLAFDGAHQAANYCWVWDAGLGGVHGVPRYLPGARCQRLLASAPA
jgi:hypothetical protein